MSPNGYPVDKNLQLAMMARSNKKRLNDDDESFGKSNKQPVLSVAAPPPLPSPLPFAPWYSCCQPPDDGGRTAAVVAAVESPPYLALVELGVVSH